MGSTCHAWRPTALQQKQLVVILNFVICLWLFQEKDAPGGWGGGYSLQWPIQGRST